MFICPFLLTGWSTLKSPGPSLSIHHPHEQDQGSKINFFVSVPAAVHTYMLSIGWLQALSLLCAGPCQLMSAHVSVMWPVTHTHTRARAHTHTQLPRWSGLASGYSTNYCRVTWDLIRTCFWHGSLQLATTKGYSIVYSIVWCTCQEVVNTCFSHCWLRGPFQGLPPCKNRMGRFRDFHLAKTGWLTSGAPTCKNQATMPWICYQMGSSSSTGKIQRLSLAAWLWWGLVPWIVDMVDAAQISDFHEKSRQPQL